MIAIDSNMHDIRRRFVQGILWKLPPGQMREYVTGRREDEVPGLRQTA